MGKKKAARVPVTERAVLQRVNRLLAEQEEQLRMWRDWKNRPAAYFHLDLRTNYLIAEHVDLEDFARDAGALRDWEEIVWKD